MKTAWRTLNQLTLVLALAGLVATPAAAQQAAQPQQNPPPGGAAQTPITVERYVVGQARPPVTEGRDLIELTLDQAYALALEKNLDLKVARMNPVITDYTKQTMTATYRPSLTGSYSYSNSTTPSNNFLDGVSNVVSVNQGYNFGMSQSFRFLGAPSASVSWTNSRATSNVITTKLNPAYNTGLSFSVNMQLLNGFKIDNNRNQWRTFPITREIADITLLNTIETTKSSVRNAYWNLRSAIEQIEIARRALELAQKSWSDSLIKVEIGTAAPIDTVTFETQVAQAEQSYLSAQNSWTTAELNFKRLLVSGTDDPLYIKTINPTDRPTLTVQNVDIQGAVTKTLAEATNLLIARKNIHVSQLNLEVTKSALLPNLSMSAGYSGSGQAGTQRLSDGTIIPGGWLDSQTALSSFNNPRWNLGFNISYPIGQLTQKANYATAQIRIDQSVAQLKAQELTTSTAVVNAGLNVANAYKLYLAAVKSREAAERNADAAQVRFDNGLLTNIEVVTAQNTMTSARLSELTRLIAYVNAIADFERIQKIGG
jgi:outer membrane protein TolC